MKKEIDYERILDKIIKYAALMRSYQIDEESLFNRLSKIDKIELEKIQDLYKGSTIDTPVNFIRCKIIDHITLGKHITSEWLNDQKREIEQEKEKNSFKSYSNFSIFYPFIEKLDSNVDVEGFWLNLTHEITKRLNLTPKDVQSHWVSFNGARGFGSERTWMAIYNASHPNQTTSKQFFFLIDYSGITLSFYDRFNNKFLAQKKFSVNDYLIEEATSFFRGYVDELLQDKFNVIENRNLGVKGCSVFKLSHGTDYFDKESIQYCISNCLAVVHEKTGSKGRQSFSQFDLFKSAKIGDVFYLTYGNSGVLLIGQFIDEIISDFDFKQNPDGWKQRKYKQLFTSYEVKPYNGAKNWWSPNDPSTFVQINPKDFNDANKNLLIPHFRVALNADIQVKLPITKQGIASDMDIPMVDKNVNPKLEVDLIASQFARLIHNMKSEKGQFLGIFGRWGRGKSFFAKRVFELINDDRIENSVNYKMIEFNAWKYQDTKAIWAYIYESLQGEYFALANNKMILRLILTFKLNLARKGGNGLLLLLLLFLTSFSIVFIVPSEWKWQIVNFLLINVGIIVILKAVLLYREYIPRFKQVYKDYIKNNGFNSQLGLQAEIQNEIKILLKTWFKLRGVDSKKCLFRRRWSRSYEKIILFIDDLDRCDESRIIEVIDSLRVMLEDEEIIEKIIIVGAIDESILKTAIEWKYKDLLDFQDNSAHNVKRPIELTTREYLDKLFIGGIKLPSLNSKEQHSILKNYAEGAGILETVPNNVSEEIFLDDKIEQLVDSDKPEFEFPESTYTDVILTQDQYFLLNSELEILQNSLNKYKKDEFTPRQLRIYLNRYLFAKNLASSYYLKETGGGNLDESYYTFLADQIAAKTVNISVEVNMEDLGKLKLQPVFEEFTIKVIKMVVPY